MSKIIEQIHIFLYDHIAVFFYNVSIIIMCQFISHFQHFHPGIIRNQARLIRFSQNFSGRSCNKSCHRIILYQNIFHEFPCQIKCNGKFFVHTVFYPPITIRFCKYPNLPDPHCTVWAILLLFPSVHQNLSPRSLQYRYHFFLLRFLSPLSHITILLLPEIPCKVLLLSVSLPRLSLFSILSFTFYTICFPVTSYLSARYIGNKIPNNGFFVYRNVRKLLSPIMAKHCVPNSVA